MLRERGVCRWYCEWCLVLPRMLSSGAVSGTMSGTCVWCLQHVVLACGAVWCSVLPCNIVYICPPACVCGPSGASSMCSTTNTSWSSTAPVTTLLATAVLLDAQVPQVLNQDSSDITTSSETKAEALQFNQVFASILLLLVG